MKMLAMLAAIPDEKSAKIIAISPTSDKWFVNATDAPAEYQEMIRDTEESGKITVLGFLFGPGEDE